MNHSNPAATNPNKMNRKPVQTNNPNNFIDENQPCIRNDIQNMKTNFSQANSPTNQILINPGNTNTNTNTNININNQAGSTNRNESSTPNKQPASSSKVHDWNLKASFGSFNADQLNLRFFRLCR